jgi:hypothetical protein
MSAGALSMLLDAECASDDSRSLECVAELIRPTGGDAEAAEVADRGGRTSELDLCSDIAAESRD